MSLFASLSHKRLVCYSYLQYCSFALTPGLIYQINGDSEKLWKGSGDVNGAIKWEGREGWKGQRRPLIGEEYPSLPSKRQSPAMCPAGTGEGRKERKASSAPSSLPLH